MLMGWSTQTTIKLLIANTTTLTSQLNYLTEVNTI